MKHLWYESVVGTRVNAGKVTGFEVGLERLENKKIILRLKNSSQNDTQFSLYNNYLRFIN